MDADCVSTRNVGANVSGGVALRNWKPGNGETSNVLGANVFGSVNTGAATLHVPKKEMAFVSSIRTFTDDEKRMRMNAVISDMNASCGTKMDLLQEPAKIIVPRPRPRHITHCAPVFCYDSQGGVYHQNGPNNLTGPNGRICHRAGQLWNCN